MAQDGYINYKNVDVIVNMDGCYEIKKKSGYIYYQGGNKWTTDRSKAKTWTKRVHADRIARQLDK